MDYIDEHYQEYDRFVVTKYIAYGPEIYIKYFDPQEQYKKIQIGSITQTSSPRTLYVIRSYELPKENFLVKHIIYYPNNRDAAYYIGEKR